MEVREATEEDIPAIVSLLKLSLGENLMPKSERYWRWKHLENPFGPSPVLVCMEGNEIIGVRAFMRWEWLGQGQVYRAVRAVDTATHPDHQGKGIFKKLTLSLVNTCKHHGDHFIFNTPNKKSKPGYLKMGWEEAGRLPIRIRVLKPISLFRNLVAGTQTLPAHEDTGLSYYFQHGDLESLLNECKHRQKTISTNASLAYLKWRYLEVPVARYVAIGEEHGAMLRGLIIGRIKSTRLGRELRITDYFGSENCDVKELMRKMKMHMREWNIDYVTISGALSDSTKKVFRGFYMTPPVGPMITVKTLSLSDLTNFKTFNQWSASLGDLELF